MNHAVSISMHNHRLFRIYSIFSRMKCSAVRQVLYQSIFTGREHYGRKKVHKKEAVVLRLLNRGKQSQFMNCGGDFICSGLKLDSVPQESRDKDVSRIWVTRVAFLVSSLSWTIETISEASYILRKINILINK